MAVFPIRTFGDPVLRKPAAEVDAVDDGVRKLMRDLVDTMRAAPGVGLAAPQIGISRRVITWQFESEEGALANPVILEREGSVESEEACLSLPGLAFPVVRAEWVRFEGLDEAGATVAGEAHGYLARILQHEVDHVDGVLFIDRLAPELQRQARRQLREQALGETPPQRAAAL